MNRPLLLTAGILVVLAPAGYANSAARRATMTGSGGDGRCTVTVSVDHAAEIEISGDKGLLTTTAGQPAAWNRFTCNAPLPRNPVDFRVVRLGGRGTVRLIQDPLRTGGRAVIQINYSQSGRTNYSFDLQWRTPGGGAWQPGPPSRPAPVPDGFPIRASIRVCQDSVTDELNQRGYSYIVFDRTSSDNSAGRIDWITGYASGQKGFRTASFSFKCSVDSRYGKIRSVDVHR